MPPFPVLARRISAAVELAASGQSPDAECTVTSYYLILPLFFFTSIILYYLLYSFVSVLTLLQRIYPLFLLCATSSTSNLSSWTSSPFCYITHPVNTTKSLSHRTWTHTD